ncbi:MAG: long-chain fatty acid--CoA ligase, partial [Treponema sp.]|nr:long-chain fatty acid--CoA ligase [Treponema sp.]
EALIYPADDLLKKLSIIREEKSENAKKALASAIQEIVDRVNKKLLPYQRITKVTVLESPLEMTTTMKVKRNYKK